MSFEAQEKNAVELDQKIQQNAETIKELSKSDSKDLEEFDKLQKSDTSLEDLRK